MKLNYIFTPHIRINSKWIIHLNVRPKTIKVLKEHIGSNISDIAHSSVWSDISPQARETKEKIKWDYIKLKSVCLAKETINKMKIQLTEWENIFTNDIFDKGLISKIYKELIKLNTRKKNTIQLKNGQRTWIDTSIQRTYRWPIDIWKHAQHH